MAELKLAAIMLKYLVSSQTNLFRDKINSLTFFEEGFSNIRNSI